MIVTIDGYGESGPVCQGFIFTTKNLEGHLIHEQQPAP